MISVFPITIVKNSLRIVTLSLLGVYVDRSFLGSSFLHTWGGIPFFLLALRVFAPVLGIVRMVERGEACKK